jgi:putative chitinase
MAFQFNFTADVLSSCIDNDNYNDWFQSIFDILSLPVYDITSKLRFAAWIAQCGHESTDFNTIQENLNYRASALLSVFPTHFNTTEAEAYQHNPEKIANRVYANRLGNGSEESGDGWLFHGRGIIQITGRDNYTKCSQSIYGDDRLLTNPDLLLQIDGAVRSACWFWQIDNLNVLADASQFESITRRINGGMNGEDDRLDRYQHAISVLSTVSLTIPVATTTTTVNDTTPPASLTETISGWWNKLTS